MLENDFFREWKETGSVSRGKEKVHISEKKEEVEFFSPLFFLIRKIRRQLSCLSSSFLRSPFSRLSMSHASAMSSRARVSLAASTRPSAAAAQPATPIAFRRRRPAMTPMRRPLSSSPSLHTSGARLPSFYPPRAAGDSAESDPYKVR